MCTLNLIDKTKTNLTKPNITPFQKKPNKKPNTNKQTNNNQD